MRLPDGFVVRLEPDVIRLAEGAVVVGGSPLTAIRSRRPCSPSWADRIFG